jgi:hypothetical protein
MNPSARAHLRSDPPQQLFVVEKVSGFPRSWHQPARKTELRRLFARYLPVSLTATLQR